MTSTNRLFTTGLAILVVGTASAFVLDGSARSAPAQPEDDGLAVDASAYAARYGVSTAEATRRLQLQAETGDLGARLAESQPDTFGGLSIEHTPVYTVTVRFTKGGAEQLAPYLDDTALASVVRITNVANSLARLQEAAEESAAAATAAGVRAAVMVDVRDNAVKVEVTNLADLAAGLQATSVHCRLRRSRSR